MNRILTLLTLSVLILPLYACGKQEAPAPKANVAALKTKANVAAPAPATAKEVIPAPDDFYMKVDACSKENPPLNKKPKYQDAVVGLTGKWAVQDNMGWEQSLDINDDGLCDYAISDYFSYTIRDYNRDANGYPFSLALRIRPGKDKKRIETSTVNGKKIEATYIDSPYVEIVGGGGGGGNADYFATPSDTNLQSYYMDNIQVPGGNNDRAVVLKIYPKSSGMPFILLPTYPLVQYSRSGVEFPEPEFNDKGAFIRMNRAKPEWNGAGGGWDIIRWDPKIKKFRDVLKEGPIFSPENAEYWAVRAWLAERYLDDSLKAFKARESASADILLELAASTDPRNLDILTWRAHFAYASARYKEAAAFYEQVVLRDQYATAKPPLEQTWFDLGLSYEAQCWQQVRDRKLGDPQGCADQALNKAQAAYQTYLKLAPNGMRAAEVRQRLQDMQKGVFRTPVGDAELAASAQWVDKLAKAFVQASRGAARPEAPVPSAGTGQPQGAKQADVYDLNPADLKKIDKEIGHLLQMKGLSFEQSRIDWMIAYKAKFPDADLNDMIARPAYYEALPWVKAWRKAYSSLPK